jgi:hypothetical protein
MYSVDWEEVIVISNSVSSEGMLEMNQYREKEDIFTKYSNLYMYNYEKYEHVILYKHDITRHNMIERDIIRHDMIGSDIIRHDMVDTTCLICVMP